ncbi:MAG: hypothetical protein J6T59_06755 [Bacteroidales bacterium]|nr:hypothetical protein [Bacteroidales bacterium]
MKKNALLGVLLLAILCSGCGFGKMVTKYPEVSITLDDENLETRGGQVAYTIKGAIPPKYMKKKATMVLAPTLKVDGQNLAPFTTITLKGEKAKGEGTTISYKKGGTFTKTGTFTFKDEYDMAEIVAPATAQLKKKSTTLNPEKILGEGIANTSSRVGFQPRLADNNNNGTAFLYAPHNYQTEFIGKTATIYFDLNSSVMNWSNKYNKSAAAKDSIKAFLNFMNEGFIISKVVISGWASPEGEETNNQGLSERRFEQGKKWFENQYDQYLRAYAKANKIKMKDLKRPTFEYVNNAKGEDWDGFEAAISQSNIAQKNQILNVVHSQPNNDMREQKIREMTDIYPEIADVILPPLRRAEMSLICQKHETYTNEELIRLVKSNPSAFSVNERLYAASVSSDLAEQELIYLALINDRNTEGDWRAYNDLGALKLNAYNNGGDPKDLDDAISYLNKAAAISPNNGVVLNNLALAQFYKGDLAAARESFNASKNASTNAVNQDEAMGVFNIVDGNYDGALQIIGNTTCNYNAALVQLLNKDYNTCLNTLNCIANPDAKTYYLKAVLAARMNDENALYSNLGSAISLDPSYKKTAKRDAEFKKYRHSDTFKNLVK